MTNHTIKGAFINLKNEWIFRLNTELQAVRQIVTEKEVTLM